MLCCRCAQVEKKLLILKSDYEFEIKKIQEDKSTEKAMYEIHLQKEVRRWQQTYEKEKCIREDENKKWMQKYDSTVTQYEEKINQLTIKHEKQLKYELESLSSKLNEKIRALTSQYQAKIEDFIGKSQAQITKLKQNHETKLNQLLSDHENKVSTLQKSHKSEIEQKTRVYSSKILGLESEKITQKKLHEDTKNESKEMQAKFYKQIFELRKNISELEYKFNDQIKETKSKEDIIQQLNSTLAKMKEDHSNQVENIHRENQKMLQECRQNYKVKLSEIYKDSLAYCNKYQQTISKIQETRESERNIYLSNIEQINLYVENRASRPEDIEEIQYLRQLLAKKMKQCDDLNEQIKFFKLELENKEQTYNKIFVPLANPGNQNIIYKRKQFKLKRQGRSVTTVREVLQSIQSANMIGQKKSVAPYLGSKGKIL